MGEGQEREAWTEAGEGGEIEKVKEVLQEIIEKNLSIVIRAGGKFGIVGEALSALAQGNNRLRLVDLREDPDLAAVEEALRFPKNERGNYYGEGFRRGELFVFILGLDQWVQKRLQQEQQEGKGIKEEDRAIMKLLYLSQKYALATAVVYKDRAWDPTKLPQDSDFFWLDQFFGSFAPQTLDKKQAEVLEEKKN